MSTDSKRLIHVFYANQLYKSVEVDRDYSLIDLGPEVYNGGYLIGSSRKWFRCDLTPVLDEDVPKELKLLALLMDL